MRATAGHRGIALRRAARRRRSAGAALFVVAITLALLAAMGVYGLSATAMDVRAAGHSREAMTGQTVAMHAFMSTAETFSPGAAQALVENMQDPNRLTKSCRTAKPWVGGCATRAAESCILLTPQELKNIARDVNPQVTPGDTFRSDSFGAGYPYQPYVQVEVTSPVTVMPPPGFESPDPNLPKVFTQATVTVFAEMKESVSAIPELNVVGRGRIIVGPMAPPICKP